MRRVFILALLVAAGAALAAHFSEFSADNASEMYAYAGPSVVRVELGGGGSGSGFFAKTPSGKTVVVTNAHVCVRRGQRLTLRSERGRFKFRGIPKIISYNRDLCAISVPEAVPGEVLEIASSDSALGDTVYVLGHPQGGHFVTEPAQVLFKEVQQVVYNPGFCDTPGGTLVESMFGSVCLRSYLSTILFGRIFPGNSGGPVVNSRGQVVGVLFAGGDAFAAALTRESLIEFLSRIK